MYDSLCWLNIDVWRALYDSMELLYFINHGDIIIIECLNFINHGITIQWRMSELLHFHTLPPLHHHIWYIREWDIYINIDHDIGFCANIAFFTVAIQLRFEVSRYLNQCHHRCNNLVVSSWASINNAITSHYMLPLTVHLLVIMQ